MIYSLIIAATCLKGPSIAPPQIDSGPQQALIDTLSGDFTLVQGGKQRSLDTKKDRGTFLSVGDMVKAKDPIHCQGRLWLAGRYLPIGSMDFVVTAAPSSGAVYPLNSYFFEGGMKKGGSTILNPTEGEAVLPKLLRIRWVPTSASLAIYIYSDTQTVFEAEHVGGRSGVYGPAAMTEALERAISRGHFSFEVELKHSNGDEFARAKFGLPRTAVEQEIESGLDYWSRVGGLAMYFGRAEILMKNKYAYEALDEYEAALKEAPESTELKNRIKRLHAAGF